MLSFETGVWFLRGRSVCIEKFLWYRCVFLTLYLSFVFSLKLPNLQFQFVSLDSFSCPYVTSRSLFEIYKGFTPVLLSWRLLEKMFPHLRHVRMHGHAIAIGDIWEQCVFRTPMLLHEICYSRDKTVFALFTFPRCFDYINFFIISAFFVNDKKRVWYFGDRKRFFFQYVWVVLLVKTFSCSSSAHWWKFIVFFL